MAAQDLADYKAAQGQRDGAAGATAAARQHAATSARPHTTPSGSGGTSGSAPASTPRA